MASRGPDDERDDPSAAWIPEDRLSPGDTLTPFMPAPGGPPLGSPGQDAPIPAKVGQAQWLLESLVEGARELRPLRISQLPFRIGRVSGLELVLPSQLVSKTHAEIYSQDGALRLRDLGSTNGTFVNRNRVEDVAIAEGDVLHFADFEFRLAREQRYVANPDAMDGNATLSFGSRALPHHFAVGTRELKEMLAQASVGVMFQPIVRLPGREVAGYEALGRGHHPNLPAAPADLFQIAESVGAAGELSRLFRRRAVEAVRHRTDLPALFLNTHPTEWEQPGLVESLEGLRRFAPGLKLMLEVHESALAVSGGMQALRARLDPLGIGLAYDDFGAGQARLIELAEAPPDFLKFDRRFVTDIDKAAASKQRLLAALVAAARELQVETVAEGVATAGEAEVVTRMGFTHAQGFLFGRPIAQEQI
jgi:EAL domain-containing protein (putative c-di-GMP-specific phosphodiesterase class I)/pSer/pThr/pTyr-binding forkhead associated (FHA) protein